MIITVSGPSEEIVVRQKSRVGIIWVNTAEVSLEAAPSFYAILTSAPVQQILSIDEDNRHNISSARVIRAGGGEEAVAQTQAYKDALIRIRQEMDVYQVIEGAVSIQDETLFRTSIQLPANIIEGDYHTEIFLIRGQEVVSKYTANIAVQKEGLERFLYTLAHEWALVYGIMSLLIAIFAGWLASAAFRWLKV